MKRCARFHTDSHSLPQSSAQPKSTLAWTQKQPLQLQAPRTIPVCTPSCTLPQFATNCDKVQQILDLRLPGLKWCRSHLSLHLYLWPLTPANHRRHTSWECHSAGHSCHTLMACFNWSQSLDRWSRSLQRLWLVSNVSIYFTKICGSVLPWSQILPSTCEHAY